MGHKKKKEKEKKDIERMSPTPKKNLLCKTKQWCALHLVLVKNIEDKWGELGGVAKGEELFVDLLETCSIKLTTRAVFYEALVPGRGKTKHYIFIRCLWYLLYVMVSRHSWKVVKKENTDKYVSTAPDWSAR